jgi:hypothetical protein
MHKEEREERNEEGKANTIVIQIKKMKKKDRVEQGWFKKRKQNDRKVVLINEDLLKIQIEKRVKKEMTLQEI